MVDTVGFPTTSLPPLPSVQYPGSMDVPGPTPLPEVHSDSFKSTQHSQDGVTGTGFTLLPEPTKKMDKTCEPVSSKTLNISE